MADNKNDETAQFVEEYKKQYKAMLEVFKDSYNSEEEEEITQIPIALALGLAAAFSAAAAKTKSQNINQNGVANNGYL